MRCRPFDPFIARMTVKRAASWANGEPCNSTRAPQNEPPFWDRVAARWTYLRNLVLNALGAAVFVGAAIILVDAISQPTIAIAPIPTPSNIAQSGYSDEVTAMALREAIAQLAEKGHTRKEKAEIASQAEIPDIVVPRTGLSVETIAAQLRKLFRLTHRWSVIGGITTYNDSYVLHLKISNGVTAADPVNSVEADDIDELLKKGAQKIVEIVDPYLHAASYSKSNPPEAIRLARKIIRNDSTGNFSFWAHLLLGYVHHNEGRYEDAASEFQKAIDIRENFNFYNLISRLYYFIRQNMGYKPDKGLSTAYNNLGSALHNLNEDDAAIKKFEISMTLDSEYALPHRNVGDIYFKRNNFTSASYEYKRASEIDTNNIFYIYKLSESLDAQNNYDEAVEELKKSLLIYPGSAKTFEKIGDLYQLHSKFNRASEAYEKAKELDPNTFYHYTDLADAYRRQFKFKEALAILDETIELDLSIEEKGRYHIARAEIFHEQSDLASSIKEFKAAVKLLPKDVFLQVRLAGLEKESYRTSSTSSLRRPAMFRRE